MKIRSNKGITLIILAITIIVILILTSIIISTARSQFSVTNINNLNSDIETIGAKVADYYLKNNDLPIFRLIDNEEKIIYAKDSEELKNIFRSRIKESINEKIEKSIANQINPNDSGAYYVINLGLLENLTLNYGKDYSKWNTIHEVSNEIYQDIYIINSITHQIYYPKGIKTQDKEYYFTKTDDENEVITEINFDRDVFEININTDTSNAVTKYTVKINSTATKVVKMEYGWSEQRDVKYKDRVTFHIIEDLENGNPVIRMNTEEIRNNVYLWIKATDVYGQEHIKILADGVILTDVRTTLYPEDKTKRIISADISVANTSSEYHYNKLEYGWSEENDISEKLKVNFIQFSVNDSGKVTIDSKPIEDTVDCYLWIKETDNYGEEHISIRNIN